MVQFNGDLLDRVVEIPVEPWTEVDFEKVAAKGAEALNVAFAPAILKNAIEASFSSISAFQELMKGIGQKSHQQHCAPSASSIPR
jgi:hypothetical protein